MIDFVHPLPQFRCILLDPPWEERGGGKSKRGADRHYPVLKKHEIIQVIYQSGYWSPAPQAHMWMWVTDNFLEDGLFVMKALGFRYVRQAIWPKPSFGLGQYLRGQHEPCLFGVKGRQIPLRTRSESSLFGDGELIKTGVHSLKPDESYKKIESVSPGPRLELFCRNRRPGWWGWGNQLRDTSVQAMIRSAR
jgi:N6-adenosine-specific RNA methylase IME4